MRVFVLAMAISALACSGNQLGAPSCTNQKKDGTETDVDCGGGSCGACMLGKACAKPSDCIDGACTNGICGTATTCANGKKDGLETDVDCGGFCARCGANATCAQPTDCVSMTCASGRC